MGLVSNPVRFLFVALSIVSALSAISAQDTLFESDNEDPSRSAKDLGRRGLVSFFVRLGYVNEFLYFCLIKWISLTDFIARP